MILCFEKDFKITFELHVFFTFCLRFHSMSVGKLHSNKVFLTLLPSGKFDTQ